MTKLQKLALEKVEVRKALVALGAKSEPLTDDEQTEVNNLGKQLTEIESRSKALILAGETPGLEVVEDDPQLTQLVSRGNVGAIFEAVVEQRSVKGPEAELQQHFKLGANQVPLAMLRSTEAEVRAVSTVPASVSHTPGSASQAEILQPVFALGDAAFLGVSMPTVPAGQAVYPVLTSRPTVGGFHRDSTSVADTTGAFSADVLTPGRLQAAFFYRRTDAAKFPGMAEALRAALNSGLSEALDQEILDQIVSDVTRTDASAIDTFSSYRSRFVYSQVDGRHASAENQVRLMMGSPTLQHAAGIFATNSSVSAVENLRTIAGGVRTSAHIAAVASEKQDVIVRRGVAQDAVAPLWEGVTLIRDEVTKAATGEIVLTAVLLAAVKVIRSSGWARIQSQHA